MNRALKAKEQNLIMRSSKVFNDQQEKFRLQNMNLTKNQQDELIKNLAYLAKLKRKEEYLSTKLANSLDA